jgi:hypothetical protein
LRLFGKRSLQTKSQEAYQQNLNFMLKESPPKRDQCIDCVGLARANGISPVFLFASTPSKVVKAWAALDGLDICRDQYPNTGFRAQQ